MAFWYKVCTVGGYGGSVARTPSDAWISHTNALKQFYGHSPPQAAHTPRLYAATTRRAAKGADISEWDSSVGSGRAVCIDTDARMMDVFDERDEYDDRIESKARNIFTGGDLGQDESRRPGA